MKMTNSKPFILVGRQVVDDDEFALGLVVTNIPSGPVDEDLLKQATGILGNNWDDIKNQYGLDTLSGVIASFALNMKEVRTGDALIITSLPQFIDGNSTILCKWVSLDEGLNRLPESDRNRCKSMFDDAL